MRHLQGKVCNPAISKNKANISLRLNLIIVWYLLLCPTKINQRVSNNSVLELLGIGRTQDRTEVEIVDWRGLSCSTRPSFATSGRQLPDTRLLS